MTRHSSRTRCSETPQPSRCTANEDSLRANGMKSKTYLECNHGSSWKKLVCIKVPEEVLLHVDKLRDDFPDKTLLRCCGLYHSFIHRPAYANKLRGVVNQFTQVQPYVTRHMELHTLTL